MYIVASASLEDREDTSAGVAQIPALVGYNTSAGRLGCIGYHTSSQLLSLLINQPSVLWIPITSSENYFGGTHNSTSSNGEYVWGISKI